MSTQYFKVKQGLVTGNIVLDEASGNITGTTVSATGNITGAYFVGNGSQLTGLPESYSNANVAAYLPTYTGNISADNITANTFTGTVNGGATTAGTVTANAQPNITSVGTLTSLSSTGNITGAYFVGNGSQLTGLPESYSNANVAAYLPTYTGNLVSLTGNVTTTANISGNFFIGNGSGLTGITGANVAGQVSNALIAGTVYTNAQPNITSVGTLSSLSVTGNISGDYILGNGSQLTGLPESYSNANVAAYLPTYTGNLVSLQGNVTTTANISGAYILGNGSQLTGIQAGATTTFGSNPPSSPNQGDVWIEADTGIQYIYFNDGTSSQWAEMEASVSISSELAAVPESSQPSNVHFLEGTTTDNVETELFVDGTTNNRIIVPVDTAMYYTVDILCKRTNGTDFAAFTLKSMINNTGNTVTDVGSVYEIVVTRTDAGISVDTRADDANNSVGVFVTGVTGKSLSWKAQVTVVEV